MRKPSLRRLKVFAARLGFYDTVVAAPSQAAALRAWGVHRDLFADGDAQPTTDAAAVAAATAHPEIPLKRPVGSTGAFEVDPSGLPKVPAPPSPGRSRPPRQGRRPRPVPDGRRRRPRIAHPSPGPRRR